MQEMKTMDELYMLMDETDAPYDDESHSLFNDKERLDYMLNLIKEKGLKLIPGSPLDKAYCEKFCTE